MYTVMCYLAARLSSNRFKCQCYRMKGVAVASGLVILALLVPCMYGMEVTKRLVTNFLHQTARMLRAI